MCIYFNFMIECCNCWCITEESLRIESRFGVHELVRRRRYNARFLQFGEFLECGLLEVVVGHAVQDRVHGRIDVNDEPRGEEKIAQPARYL